MRNKLTKYRVKPLCYGNHLEPTNNTKYKQKSPYTSLLSHPKWNYVWRENDVACFALAREE